MSCEASFVPDLSINSEFFENLKAISVLQSLDTYCDSMKKLHIQLKIVIQNGINNNKVFVFQIMNNLYRIVPLFDKILLNGDQNGNDNYIQTKKFLETLTKVFDGVCLFEVFGTVKPTQSVQSIFKHYIVLLKEIYFTDDTKYDDLVNCLLPILIFSIMLNQFTEADIPPNLLNYLLIFTRRHWLSKEREWTIRNILAVVKCFSKNPLLVPMVIRNQWPHACVQWLDSKDIENGQRPSFTVDYYICLIIQKLARHSKCIEILNQLNCLKRFDECQESMKKSHSESDYKCLHLIHGMIYALLTEADEIKQISFVNDTRMCQVLDDVVTCIVEASRTELFFYKCFHVSEMLIVLSKLFVNDDIVLKVVNNNNQLFEHLSQLMMTFDKITRDTNRAHQPHNDESLLALTNLLWSISFHECYSEQFKENPILMNIIKNIATTSSSSITTRIKLVPRDMSSLKKAAEGILWNLEPKSSTSSSELSNEKLQQPLAMISYSHSDSTFCRELVERLSTHVPVWVDYKQAKDTVAHSDDVWEEIARAMELATVIVLIVSKDYYNSKSCRQELSYASDTLKKRIIPIYPPNQQYRANGWLGIRIAGQKYIHFGRRSLPEAIIELSSIILTDQTLNLVISAPLVASSTSKSNQNKIINEENSLLLTLKNWTTNDIQKWFEDNHIHKDLITLCSNQFHTGTSLIVYARHLKLFYRNEYIRIFKSYSKLFNGKKLNTFDFVTFVDALYRLRSEYDPNSTTEDSYEKISDQQLPSLVKCTDEKITRL